ncbi:alpha/beta fold hydrolase [Streptomyces sp. NPDC003487]
MPTSVTPAYARTVHGRGPGRPGLLLAHGASGSVQANYGPIMEGLAADRTVVGVDYPGTGATPRAQEPLSLDELADQLVAAADAEGLGTFAVSGYSLGGPVAIRLAVRHPERVEALALTASFAHADRRTELVASLWQRLHDSGQHDLLAAYMTLMTLSEPALNALTPGQLRESIEGLAAGLPVGTGDHVALVRTADVRADLARITVPTLVVVTTGDPLVHPALQRRLADALPHTRVAELPTGHLPFVERPAEWLRLLTGFLAETRTRDHA